MLRRLGRLLTAVLALLAVLVPLVAGRVVDGYTAFQWTCYHAAQPIGAVQARKTARWAARTIDRVAPLPLAADAARLALQTARALEPRNREASIAAYVQVRSALEAVQATRGRGLGLGGLVAEAAALENAARPAGAEN